MHAVQLSCPQCGAPLPLRQGQTIVICAWCNTSSRVFPVSPIEVVGKAP